MDQFTGRVAFVTGGASGMGLGIAKALAREGAVVAIGDLRADRLSEARTSAAAEGITLHPYPLDVTDRAAHERIADRIERELGAASIIALNAGVGIIGHIKDATYDDWDWILGVNLGGCINGVRTFVPRLRQARNQGHIVATASMGGLVVADSGGIYSAAKFGVVAMMQCLREDLGPEGIGVSVLCPAAVNTNIHEHYRLRPKAFAHGAYTQTVEEEAALKRMLARGMSPEQVGELVVQGIRSNQLYIMTSGAIEPIVAMRRDALIASLPPEPHNEARWQADLAARRFMAERLL